jgi:integrase
MRTHWRKCGRYFGCFPNPLRQLPRILRHANVSTTATYYIKTVAEDIRNVMVKLENNIPQTQSDTQGTPSVQACSTPASVN